VDLSGSAIQLPEADLIQVCDVLQAGQTEKLYAIPIDPKTLGVQLDLQPMSSTKPFTAQMFLYAGTGEPLSGPISGGDVSGGPVYIPHERLGGSDWMIVRVADFSAGSVTSLNASLFARPELFSIAGLGAPFSGLVSALNALPFQRLELLTNAAPGAPSSGSAPSLNASPFPEGFLLNIQQVPISPGTVAATGGFDSSTSYILPSVLSQGFSTSSLAVSADPINDAGTVDLYASVGNSIDVQLGAGSVRTGVVPQLAPTSTITGPLPARSAGPLGGILAVGDPAPPIDVRGVAQAALDRLDLLLDEIGVELTEPEGVAGVTEAAGGLVPVRGLGGVPLLGSSLDGRGDLDVERDGSAATWLAQTAPMAAPVPDPPGARSESTGLARGDAALRGLTVALTFAFGLIRPDLATALRPAGRTRPRLRLGVLRRGGWRIRVRVD
jgi:hypothetical protein